MQGATRFPEALQPMAVFVEIWKAFYIDWVPDYAEEERFPKKEEVKKRRLSIFSRFFGGKSST